MFVAACNRFAKTVGPDTLHPTPSIDTKDKIELLQLVVKSTRKYWFSSKITYTPSAFQIKDVLADDIPLISEMQKDTELSTNYNSRTEIFLNGKFGAGIHKKLIAFKIATGVRISVTCNIDFGKVMKKAVNRPHLTAQINRRNIQMYHPFIKPIQDSPKVLCLITAVAYLEEMCILQEKKDASASMPTILSASISADAGVKYGNSEYLKLESGTPVAYSVHELKVESDSGGIELVNEQGEKEGFERVLRRGFMGKLFGNKRVKRYSFEETEDIEGNLFKLYGFNGLSYINNKFSRRKRGQDRYSFEEMENNEGTLFKLYEFNGLSYIKNKFSRRKRAKDEDPPKEHACEGETGEFKDCNSLDEVDFTKNVSAENREEMDIDFQRPKKLFGPLLALHEEIRREITNDLLKILDVPCDLQILANLLEKCEAKQCRPDGEKLELRTPNDTVERVLGHGGIVFRDGKAKVHTSNCMLPCLAEFFDAASELDDDILDLITKCSEELSVPLMNVLQKGIMGETVRDENLTKDTEASHVKLLQKLGFKITSAEIAPPEHLNYIDVIYWVLTALWG